MAVQLYKMGLRTFRFISNNMKSLSTLNIILALLMTLLPTTKCYSCQNGLTTEQNGLYNFKSDIYDLKNVLSSCSTSINARYGTSINQQVYPICKSVQFNLELLCNMTIQDETSINVRKIWKDKYNGTNICQDMAKDVYEPQEDCERLLGSSTKDRCTTNKDIIDKSLKQEERFCSLCSSIRNSDMNICVTLLKVWQTLLKISDATKSHNEIDNSGTSGVTDDVASRNLHKNSSPLYLNGRGQQNQGADYDYMNAPGSRMEQRDRISQEVFNPQFFQSLWNDSLKQAAKKFISAPQAQQRQPGNPSTEPNLMENGQSNDSNILKLNPNKTFRKQLVPEYDESNQNNTKSTNEYLQIYKSTILNNTSTNSSFATEPVKALPMVSQKEQPQNQDSEQGNEIEIPVQDINPSGKDNDAVPSINENVDANVDPNKLLTVPQENNEGPLTDVVDTTTNKIQNAPLGNEEINDSKQIQINEETPLKDNDNPIFPNDGANEIETIKADSGIQTENPQTEIKINTDLETNKENNEVDIVDETPHSSADITKQPFEDHMNSNNEEPESSNFMAYFFAMTIFTICAYLIFYNKKKLIALILEGRKGRSTGRRSRSGSGSRNGRSSSAQYRKLDNNLEEAMGPNSSTSFSQVIY